jgi:hypothetical protein
VKRDEDWRERKKKVRAKKVGTLLFLFRKKNMKTSSSPHEQKYNKRADVRTQISESRCQKADSATNRIFLQKYSLKLQMILKQIVSYKATM